MRDFCIKELGPNIIGGIIASIIFSISCGLIKYIKHLKKLWSLKNLLFGKIKIQEMTLCYTSFDMNEDLSDSMPSGSLSTNSTYKYCKVDSTTENGNQYAMIKHPVSEPEIRAIEHIVPFCAKWEIPIKIQNSKANESKYDKDILSLGFVNSITKRTAEASFFLTDEYNLYFQMRTPIYRAFRFWKEVSHPNPYFYCSKEHGYDYGVILRIHPQQFKKKSWICCAGNGAWGTSGAAYFLSHQYHKIKRSIPLFLRPFLPLICRWDMISIIRVKVHFDESAELVGTWVRIFGKTVELYCNKEIIDNAPKS